MKTLAFLLLALLNAGCVHTYDRTVIKHGATLNRQGSAYVAVPDDGRFEKISYPGSGMKTAIAVQQAFATNLLRAEIANARNSFEGNLNAARTGKFSYLVSPSILHWEDRATEWSSAPDRIQIEVRVVDTATGETIEHATVNGKSKWATLGGDHPEYLLRQPLADYADWIFGGQAR